MLWERRQRLRQGDFQGCRPRKASKDGAWGDGRRSALVGATVRKRVQLPGTEVLVYQFMNVVGLDMTRPDRWCYRVIKCDDPDQQEVTAELEPLNQRGVDTPAVTRGEWSVVPDSWKLCAMTPRLQELVVQERISPGTVSSVPDNKDLFNSKPKKSR